jgi:hypothetical protein
MPCCCRQRADKGLNDPVFVPYKDRKCTDALFCLIFLLFWLGMAVIAAIAFVQVRSCLVPCDPAAFM